MSRNDIEAQSPEELLSLSEFHGNKHVSSWSATHSTQDKPQTLFQWFATTTTFHGFSRVVESKSKVRQVAWVIAIIIAFCVVVSIITERVNKYFQYETTTQIEKVWYKKLEFPAVTICNYNMIRKSSLAGFSSNDYIMQNMIQLSSMMAPILRSAEMSFPYPGDNTNVSQFWSPNSTDYSSYYYDVPETLRSDNVTYNYEDADNNYNNENGNEIMYGQYESPQPEGRPVDNPLLIRLQERCSYISCNSETEFRCPTTAGGCCLHRSYLCNGFAECRDGADESEEAECADKRKRSLASNWMSDINQNDTVSEKSPEQELRSVFEEMEENGWQLVDKNFSDPSRTTLLECSFNKDICDTKWYKRVLTKMGTCYTFNHPDIVSYIPVQTPLVQKLPGPQFGLRLFVDLQQFDYTSLDLNVGAKVLVHRKDEMPDITREGINIPVGFQANINLEQTWVHNLQEPWGKCDRKKKLKLSDLPYTLSACAEECRLHNVLEKCECRPYYMQKHRKFDTMNMCNNSQWYSCSLPLLDKIDADFEAFCDCPPSCDELSYKPGVSYIGFTKRYSAVEYLHQRYFGSGFRNLRSLNEFMNEYYRENVVGLHVSFDSMIGTNITQLKELDELSLLGQIGGHLGLFVGVSILTLCEVIEMLILACSRNHSFRAKRLPPPNEETVSTT